MWNQQSRKQTKPENSNTDQETDDEMVKGKGIGKNGNASAI